MSFVAPSNGGRRISSASVSESQTDSPRKGRAINSCETCRTKKAACKWTIGKKGSACDSCILQDKVCKPAQSESIIRPVKYITPDCMTPEQAVLYEAFRELQRRTGMTDAEAERILRQYNMAESPVAGGSGSLPSSPEFGDASPPALQPSASALSSRSGSEASLNANGPVTPLADDGEYQDEEASDGMRAGDSRGRRNRFFSAPDVPYGANMPSSMGAFQLIKYKYTPPSIPLVALPPRRAYDMEPGLTWVPSSYPFAALPVPTATATAPLSPKASAPLIDWQLGMEEDVTTWSQQEETFTNSPHDQAMAMPVAAAATSFVTPGEYLDHFG